MDEFDDVLTILGIYAALAALAAIVAAVKGRSSFGWLIATLIFPPLLLLLFFLPSVRGKPAEAPGKAEMPSWTQPAARRSEPSEALDQSDALQVALARAGTAIQSESGKRLVRALAKRAAHRDAAQQREQEREQRRERHRQPRPAREARASNRSQPKKQPEPAPAAVPAAPPRDRPEGVLLAKSWRPKTSAVRRSGSRETVIYRRS